MARDRFCDALATMPHVDNLPTCACGCGATLQRRGRSGPAPTYATAACRMRALRNRRMADEFTPLPEVVRDAPVRLEGRSVDEQVQRALMEARAVSFALLRLGAVARPELAWRCTRVGQAIQKSLESTFGRMMQ